MRKIFSLSKRSSLFKPVSNEFCVMSVFESAQSFFEVRVWWWQTSHHQGSSIAAKRILDVKILKTFFLNVFFGVPCTATYIFFLFLWTKIGCRNLSWHGYNISIEYVGWDETRTHDLWDVRQVRYPLDTKYWKLNVNITI